MFISSYPFHRLLMATFVVCCCTGGMTITTTDSQQQRIQLVEKIKKDLQENADFLDKDHIDERVLAAIERVPRHEFIPQKYRHQAYKNRPLPIGYGQTISQPTVVAIMTDLLQVEASDKLLEIGTGSGYQAAILAELTADVYTIEIVEELAERAALDLKRTGYRSIHTFTGDGYYGWKAAAPFDGIIVTAASSHIPPPLIEQLKPGGRMIVPVGGRFMIQHLVLLTKDTDNNITTREILPVNFVPLTGSH